MDGKADVIVGADREPFLNPSAAGRAYVFGFPVASQVIVNDMISPMSLLPTFTPGDNIFQFMLNMTNTSSDTIFAPVSVSIDMLTPPPPDVEVDNST